MPASGVALKKHQDILSFEEIEKIAKTFIKLGVTKIRLTGGEPLIRKGIIDLIERLSSIKALEEIALTTNGLVLDTYAKELKNAGLNRVNISIDTLDKEKYKKITLGSNLEDVFKGIHAAKKVGLTPIKLNVVLIKDFNDNEIEDFIHLTKNEDIDVRFIELMTLGNNRSWTEGKYLSNEIVLDKNKSLKAVPKMDRSSPAKYYKVPGYKGKIGLINPISCQFCDDCNRVRITSTGKLKLCLHSDKEYDLKKYLSSKVDLSAKVLHIIKNKPKEHKLNEGVYIMTDMHKIGG